MLILPILIISCYLERQQLAKQNRRKEKIKNALSTVAEFQASGFFF